MKVSGPRDLIDTQAGQMIGAPLHVDETQSRTLAQPFDKGNERDLRGIPLSVEHRLPRE
jgi:hypothetical protein